MQVILASVSNSHLSSKAGIVMSSFHGLLSCLSYISLLSMTSCFMSRTQVALIRLMMSGSLSGLGLSGGTGFGGSGGSGLIASVVDVSGRLLLDAVVESGFSFLNCRSFHFDNH